MIKKQAIKQSKCNTTKLEKRQTAKGLSLKSTVKWVIRAAFMGPRLWRLSQIYIPAIVDKIELAGRWVVDIFTDF